MVEDSKYTVCHKLYDSKSSVLDTVLQNSLIILFLYKQFMQMLLDVYFLYWVYRVYRFFVFSMKLISILSNKK